MKIVDIVDDDGPPNLPRHQLKAVLIGIGPQSGEVMLGLLDQILEICAGISSGKRSTSDQFV